MPSTRKERLAKAREKKTKAGQILAYLESGTISVREILIKSPPSLANVRIHRILEKTPHMGPVKSRQVLLMADIWPLETLGNLSKSERIHLLRALPPKVK